MRIVSWNLGYMKPAHYKTYEIRQRQWAALMALAPDVALLQECRPDDLTKFLPQWANDEYAVVGKIPSGWVACSAVLARRSLNPTLVTGDEPWFGVMSGYLARARISHETLGELHVASVHAVAREVDDAAVSSDDHLRIKRAGCELAWYCDLAAHALRPWVGDQFIVGGDWNTARLFDTMYPGKWPEAGADFFKATASWGWSESLRRYHDDEIRTYLDADSAAYENDHLFASARLGESLTRCDVIDEPALQELSDHAPIVAEFATR